MMLWCVHLVPPPLHMYMRLLLLKTNAAQKRIDEKGPEYTIIDAARDDDVAFIQDLIISAKKNTVLKEPNHAKLFEQTDKENLKDQLYWGQHGIGPEGNLQKEWAKRKIQELEVKEKQLNEVRYSQFKTQSKTRAPQEQLHIGVKEIYSKLDEINKLVDYATRMKTELKGDAEEMNFLKRTHNSLFKINEKIQSINNKIKDLTE